MQARLALDVFDRRKTAIHTRRVNQSPYLSRRSLGSEFIDPDIVKRFNPLCQAELHLVIWR